MYEEVSAYIMLKYYHVMFKLDVTAYNVKGTVYKDNVSACIVGVSSYSVDISSYNEDFHIRHLRRSILEI